MSRDQTNGNCLGIVSQLAEASLSLSFSLFWPAHSSSIAYLATFSLEFSQGWANTRPGRMRAALPFIFALAWGICLPAVGVCVCVYPCTICNWVLFFNCFLRQKLLFTWQILAQVLAYATPTHKEKATIQAASQAATVLVGCHAHPRQGPLSIPFPASCSLSKVLLHQSFCYASLSFFGPLRLSSQNLSRLLFLRRELESSSNWSRS